MSSTYPVLADGRIRFLRKASSHIGAGLNVMYGDGSVSFLGTPALIQDGVERTSGSVKTSYFAHDGQTELPDNPVNDGEVNPYSVLITRITYYVYGELWNRSYYLQEQKPDHGPVPGVTEEAVSTTACRSQACSLRRARHP